MDSSVEYLGRGGVTGTRSRAEKPPVRAPGHAYPMEKHVGDCIFTLKYMTWLVVFMGKGRDIYRYASPMDGFGGVDDDSIVFLSPQKNGNLLATCGALSDCK